jgi:hypothetical protein
MRFVRVSVPSEKRTSVTDMLNDEGIDYDITGESADNPKTVIAFPLPTSDVESTLGRLREVGVTDEAWTVVLDTQTVVSDRLNRHRIQDADRAGRRGRRTRVCDRAVGTFFA